MSKKKKEMREEIFEKVHVKSCLTVDSFLTRA
jgi:hypothetical protein